MNNQTPNVPDETEFSDTDLLRRRIAGRAYQLYEARGRVDGFDLQDWLQAEREILGESSSPKKPQQPAVKPCLPQKGVSDVLRFSRRSFTPRQSKRGAGRATTAARVQVAGFSRRCLHRCLPENRN
jgi:Protein of unknown function (DUF2934)